MRYSTPLTHGQTPSASPYRARAALRRSELQTLADTVTTSAVLMNAGLPGWDAVRELGRAISSEAVRTVPLDLNPGGNIVLGPEGPGFIDLDGFGLDFVVCHYVKYRCCRAIRQRAVAGVTCSAGRRPRLVAPLRRER